METTVSEDANTHGSRRRALADVTSCFSAPSPARGVKRRASNNLPESRQEERNGVVKRSPWMIAPANHVDNVVSPSLVRYRAAETKPQTDGHEASSSSPFSAPTPTDQTRNQAEKSDSPNTVPAHLPPDTNPNDTLELWRAVMTLKRQLTMYPSTSKKTPAWMTGMPGQFPPPKIVSGRRLVPVSSIFGRSSGVAAAGSAMPAEHHVRNDHVDAFVNAATQARSPYMSLAELADLAQRYLIRYTTTAPAEGQLSAKRILDAQPDSQDEDASRWRIPRKRSITSRQQSGHDASQAEKDEHPQTCVATPAHASFWLLLQNLDPELSYELLASTGAFHRSAIAPYFSACYCTKDNCSHQNRETCDAVRVISDVGNTSLYNRYLLREEQAFLQKKFSIDTEGLAHFTVVVG